MKQTAKDLVARMTLEEKAGLCSGADFWHMKSVERLGIPSVMVSDGPHGLRKQKETGGSDFNDSIQAVCFPAACATAASFDESLLGRLGETMGEECRAEKVAVLLGPAVNMKRSPLCGRNFEYFSEDPYLAGKLAASLVRGVQKWDVGTSVKHFAANNQEYRRLTCSSDLSERALREIYLAAFETVVKEAKPWTLMCSYNLINGVYSSENRRLLTDILRGEWGFDGAVMSDWGAVNDRVKGLAAGLDLEMPQPAGDCNRNAIIDAVQNGRLDEAVLDRAACRLVSLILQYAGASHPEATFDRAAHHKIAARLETGCAVLLRNQNVLPLDRSQKVAYIGGFAAKPRYQGGGSSHIHSFCVTGALEAARAAGMNPAYAEGFPADSDRADPARLDQAVETAKAADVAVIFAGLPDSYESEGYDRRHMRLPACQNDLIARIAAVQKRTVVVLHTGSPVETPWADQVAGILCMYLGGEGTGEATDALLYGQVCPSGRLPETWPLRLEDTPCYLSFPGDGKHSAYSEGVFMGYRYYDKKKMPVRWPFGYGLSYTTFSYGNARLSDERLTDGGTVTVSLDVTNTGAVAGSEVVQLYVSDRTGTPLRPEKELKGFAKVALEPGQTKTVSFAVNPRSLAYYREDMHDWYAASGEYRLLLAHSSREIRAELPLRFTTSVLPPLHVDENTTIGELLADPRTAAATKARLDAVNARQPQQPVSEESKEAIGDEMNREMMLSAPLRSLRTFNGMTDQEVRAVIDEMNRQLH